MCSSQGVTCPERNKTGRQFVFWVTNASVPKYMQVQYKTKHFKSKKEKKKEKR